MSQDDDQNEQAADESPAPTSQGKLKRFLVRFGGVAFLFFFLKGLAWIAVFFYGWKFLN